MAERAPRKARAARCGSWHSPIGSEWVAAGSVGLSGIALDGEDLYWVENRPAEQGRHAIVKRGADGHTRDVLPAPWNARTRVHEYGGGSYAVHAGELYFSNWADQRLYRLAPGGAPVPLTAPGERCYADAVVDARRGRLLCVLEEHGSGAREPANHIASVPLAGGEPRALISGADFYASPRLCADGSSLCWLSWNHPDLPWDGCELWRAPVHPDGSLGPAELVAGGREESIFQPQWSPDGRLYFISDRSGWWNLYRTAAAAASVEPLCPLAADFGVPQWIFGLSTYAFESAERIACCFSERGRWQLAQLDTRTLRLERIETPYTRISDVRALPGRALFVTGSPLEPGALVCCELASGRCERLRTSSELALEPDQLSAPETLEFPSAAGAFAHAFFYPARSRECTGLPGERPPLLVMSHGGPTSATSSALRWAVQFWTSRGIAVLDVNYRGSSGYGRAYRQSLRGQWGVADVEDCIHGARFLVARGDVDGRRLAITGGSAGGYTTLCALTFHDCFAAGASHFGVSDPIALERDTHKFESRYLQGLIGPYPERRELWLARSPIHHAARLGAPVIFFQGLEDKVVPPDQTERMVAALREKKLPVAYIAFPGEQHGFRQAPNIRRALDAELYFYSRIFGFEPADPIEPVAIENL
jgi:dipeptidyl aminopeptidase/acylaminoacyl peptidase